MEGNIGIMEKKMETFRVRVLGKLVHVGVS